MVMRVKPLKDLLKQADEFCSEQSLSKTASAQNSEVSALVNLLTGADAEVTLNYDPEASKQTEIDKIAESLNRIQTATEIDAALKLIDFEKKAQVEGFTAEQINEALSKIAAEKIAKNIPLLAAMGFINLTDPEDKNSLPKNPSGKSQGKLLGKLNLMKSVGY